MSVVVGDAGSAASLGPFRCRCLIGAKVGLSDEESEAGSMWHARQAARLKEVEVEG